MKAPPEPVEFASLSAEEKRAIVTDRATTVLILPLAITNVGAVLDSLPVASSDAWTEIAPTPLALENSAAAQIYALSPDTPQGEWQRFVIYVYRHGGHIDYRQHDERNIRIRVRF